MKRMSTAGPVVAFLLLAFATAAFSQPNAWPSYRQSPEPDGVWNVIYSYPGGSYGLTPTGTVFDPSRRQLVVFGNDGIWFKPVTPPLQYRFVAIRDWAGIPTAYSAIYDPRRDRIVVLTLASGLYHVEAFALSLDNPVHWDRLVPSGASPDLSYAAAVYDPVNDRMVVYGGVDFSKSRDAVGEVWELSLGNRPRWTRIEPRGPSPPPRMDHTAVYDAENGAMVVYGGRTALQGSVLGDVWSLDLGQRPRWRPVLVEGVAPTSRTGHAAIYDARWRRMIVFGGRKSAGLSRDQYYQDLWALSLTGRPHWRQLSPSGVSPGAFGFPIAFADASRNRMLLTSGSGSFLWAVDWGADWRLSNHDSVSDNSVGFANPAVSDPREMSLRLTSGAWRSGVLMAHVSLPQATGASLGLFDASGRRVWAAGPSALQQGAQQVAIAPEGRLAAGLYFVRLEQAGHAEAVKVVKLP